MVTIYMARSRSSKNVVFRLSFCNLAGGVFCMQWIGGHGSPRKAFEGLVEGATVHAISDGTWSLTDGLCEILRIVGKCDLAVSTWTAAQADLKRAERLLRSREVKSLRLMVDRSFQTRQPGYCALARKLFGDDAIRVWSSHAKFAIFSGGRFDVLYLTSANMNQNKRLENHTVVAGGVLPEQYLDMVEELFDIQASGAAFGAGQKTARRDMETIYRARARS